MHERIAWRVLRSTCPPPGGGAYSPGVRPPTDPDGSASAPGDRGVVWADAASTPPEERFPGIVVRRLWRGESGARALMLEIAPGARWRGIDRHEPGPEEVFVAAGTFDDGVRTYPAGTFIHNPAGSHHVPGSRTGCTLFVFYPEG